MRERPAERLFAGQTQGRRHPVPAGQPARRPPGRCPFAAVDFFPLAKRAYEGSIRMVRPPVHHRNADWAAATGAAARPAFTQNPARSRNNERDIADLLGRRIAIDFGLISRGDDSQSWDALDPRALSANDRGRRQRSEQPRPRLQAAEEALPRRSATPQPR